MIENQIKSGSQDEYAKLFYEAFIAKNELPLQEHFVALGNSKPTLTVLAQDEGTLRFKNVRWIMPYTYTDKNGKTVTRDLLNSTCEKVFFQHKDSIYDKRCIVAINGYFEYYHYQKEVYPHLIYPREGIFYAGGIWKQTVDEKTGELIDCLSIITTPPNQLAQKLHNNPKAPNGSRMLLLLPNEKVMHYLDPNLKQNDIKALLTPLDVSGMLAHPVMRFQRKEYFEFIKTPKVLEPFDYPELVA